MAPEFFQELRSLGYVEGRTLFLEIRASPDLAQLPGLARELVESRLDLIVGSGTPEALALKSATRTIPIVFLVSADPVGSGLVQSLARPGGNVTGPSLMSLDFAAKRLGLFKDILPRLKQLAILHGVGPNVAKQVKELEAAARTAQVHASGFLARGPEDFDDVFTAMARKRVEGVLVVNSPIFVAARERLAALSLRARLPTMFEEWRHVDAGGLMAYGPSYPERFRRAARYVDQILRGSKPAELPVEQPTRLELIINLRTAKALGLTIPASLLQRADRVIE
jgi:putative ABC transport system substrate-binding protein